MTTLYDIDKFCDYFEAQVSAIDELEPKPVAEESITQVRLYKKTLIISAIETLSSLRFLKNNYKELINVQNILFVLIAYIAVCIEDSLLSSLKCKKWAEKIY